MAPEQRVLVTGFEPWADHALNPAQRLAERLDGWRHRDLRAVGLVLPVAQGAANATVLAALRDLRPSLAKGRLEVAGDDLRMAVRCPRTYEACHDGRIFVTSAGRSEFEVAAGGFELRGGRKRTIALEMTRAAQRHFAAQDGLRVRIWVTSAETVRATKLHRVAVDR